MEDKCEKTYGEDDRSNRVVVIGGQDGVLMRLGGPRLFSANKARADPNGSRAPRETRRETFSVVDSASGDHLDLLAGQGR